MTDDAKDHGPKAVKALENEIGKISDKILNKTKESKNYLIQEIT